MLCTKESREDLLHKVPVVHDFSSRFFPPDVKKQHKVRMCGGFYSQYFNVPFL